MVSRNRVRLMERICLLTSLILFLFAVTPQAEASPDIVDTFDSELFVVPTNAFSNGSTVFVTASDGATIGGLANAIVTDETFGDSISIELHDDGSGPGDVPDDGTYTGNFTLMDDQGASGQFTDDVSDTIDLADGGMAIVTVDIDMMMDPGTAQIQADFSVPNVTINSGEETVDLCYNLNVSVTDANVDMNEVWYNVDDGTYKRMTWQGGNYFESVVDAQTLPNGPHTIRVVAFDSAGNYDDSQTVRLTVDHPSPPAPDLLISATYEPVEPKEDDTIVFTVDIENTGTANANDVIISLKVDGIEVDQQMETIEVGETRTIQVQWKAKAGHHTIGIGVADSGISLASIPDISMDILASEEPFFDNPWIPVLLFAGLLIGVLGGTIGWAYLSKETGKARRAKTLPAEETDMATVGEHDPCEEIRRKWKTIFAEHQRAEAEMESTGQQVNVLRKKAEARAGQERNHLRLAEEEFENLKHEVESLGNRAEAFRQKWRICLLKRLDEAADRAETASREAAEATRRAREATSPEDYEKAKDEAIQARKKTGEAKEDAEGIKKKLQEDGMDEDISEYDDRIGRADRDAASSVDDLAEPPG